MFTPVACAVMLVAARAPAAAQADQPFGDVVSWDLIRRPAIAFPLFGLKTA